MLHSTTYTFYDAKIAELVYVRVRRLNKEAHLGISPNVYIAVNKGITAHKNKPLMMQN